MRRLVVLSLLVVSLLVSACDYIRPDMAVHGVLEAVQRSDLTALQGSLTGPAADQFGSTTGMSSLQAYFGQHPSTQEGETKLVDREYRDGVEVFRSYETDFASSAKFLVACDVTWISSPEHPGEEIRMVCLVSDIELRG